MVKQEELDRIVDLRKAGEKSVGKIAEQVGWKVSRVRTVLNANRILSDKPSVLALSESDQRRVAKWLAGNGGEKAVVDLTPAESAVADAVRANEEAAAEHDAKKVARPTAKTQTRIAAKAGAKPATKRARRKKS